MESNKYALLGSARVTAVAAAAGSVVPLSVVRVDVSKGAAASMGLSRFSSIGGDSPGLEVEERTMAERI